MVEDCSNDASSSNLFSNMVEKPEGPEDLMWAEVQVGNYNPGIPHLDSYV